MSKESALAIAIGSPEPVPANAPVIGSPPVQEAPKELESARFAAQARKEAEFVKKQQALKAEQEEFTKRRTQVDEILKKRDLFEDTKKKNPIEALKLIGFSEQDIFNFMAAQEKPEPTSEEKAAAAAEKAAQAKIDAFEKAQAEKTANEVKAKDNELLGEFKAGLAGIVASDPGKYEYCSHYGPQAIELAYKTVLQIVEDSQGTDIPTTEEAMQMIEELYEEEAKAIMGLKKNQPKIEGDVVEVESVPERTRTVTTPKGHEPVAPAIQKTRPLSNAARPTAASLERKAPETREQKRERLAEALRRGGLGK